MSTANPMMVLLKAGVMIILAGLAYQFFIRSRIDPSIIDSDALVIDVRSSGEFTGGHIDGAINIPHGEIGSTIEGVEPDRSRVIIVYCHSGSRSATAKRTLERAGYTQVVNGGSLYQMKRALR